MKEPHQRSGAKREPCAAWQNRERDRQYREQERMRHAGQTYTMPMVEPFATATATVPFTVPRMASAILLASRSPGFPKKEVSGDENAVRQRCAVAEVPEQRNQRNQGTEIVGSATRRRGACPGGDALPGSHSITAFGLPRLACPQRSSYSPAPGSCAILASSVLRSSISRTSSKCAPRRHNPGTLISRRVCPGFQRARVDPLHAADPPAFDGYLMCRCFHAVLLLP